MSVYKNDKVSAKWSMGKKFKTHDPESHTTPGPGNYNPDDKFDTMRGKSPNYIFGIKNPHDRKNRVDHDTSGIGPKYETNYSTLNTKGCNTYKNKRPDIYNKIKKYTNEGGPADYNPIECHKQSTKQAFAMARSLRPGMSLDLAGPKSTKYNPEFNLTKSKVDNTSIFGKNKRLNQSSIDKIDSVGPGEYNWEKAKQNPNLTAWNRDDKLKSGKPNSIGPGRYEISLGDISLNRNQHYTFRKTLIPAKTDRNLHDQPGPAEYNPDKKLARKNDLLSNRFGKEGRPYLGANNKYPGPGRYNTTKGFEFIDKNLSFNKDASREDIRPNTTCNVGPGIYNPGFGQVRSANQTGTIFSRNKRMEDNRTVSPSPAKYATHKDFTDLPKFSIGKESKTLARDAQKRTDKEALGPGQYNSNKLSLGLKNGNCFGRESRFRVKMPDGPGYYHNIKSSIGDSLVSNGNMYKSDPLCKA